MTDKQLQKKIEEILIDSFYIKEHERGVSYKRAIPDLLSLCKEYALSEIQEYKTQTALEKLGKTVERADKAIKQTKDNIRSGVKDR